MKTNSNWVVGPLVGALVGTFWFFAYSPTALSLPLLAASHATAGLALQIATMLLTPRWRASESIALGLLGGLFLGPLFVVMPYAWGWLAGLEGLLAICGAIGIGVLLGLEAGRHGVKGAIVILLLSTGAIWANGSSISERDLTTQMAALHVVSDFPEQPVAVIGIDGADWQVLSPMIERGELPNLEALIARGRHGVFRSIEPTLSPVVWTTIFAGQPAEVHGLRNWSTSDNRNRRVPMLWDLFGAHDRASLVVNIPGTWPPALVRNGRLLAGFPIPGIVSGGRGQLTGTVLSSQANDKGAVATAIVRETESGDFAFDLPIAAPLLRPRVTGISHPLIDAATQDRLIPVSNDSLRGELRFESDRVVLRSDEIDRPIDLPLDRWSEWIRFAVSDGHAYLRARVLEAGSDRMRIYLTPAFQNPHDPRYPFTSNVDASVIEDLDVPYIVEGVGWRAHRDERVAAFLPTVLIDIERAHADTALALLRREAPDLFAYAITMTDRIQHPFWRDHEPAPYRPTFEPHRGLAGRDPVEDAYRAADGLVGRFLDALPSDVLVFVVSDHGVSAALEHGEGGHRVEGIWIAAGPGIEPATEAEELSILDFVPTLLHCIGAPAAEDMPGRPATGLCPGSTGESGIASYRSETAADDANRDESDVTIDATREEQLRSLGYIE
jgi:hypothetical protein